MKETMTSGILNRRQPLTSVLEGVEMAPNGQFTAAELMLQRALLSDPKNPATYVQLGRLYHLKGKMQEAYDAYWQAWMLAPSEAATLYEMGTVLADMGDRERARPMFHEALRLDPELFEARARLARLYYEDHDYDTATRLLRDVPGHRYETGEDGYGHEAGHQDYRNDAGRHSHSELPGWGPARAGRPGERDGWN